MGRRGLKPLSSQPSSSATTLAGRAALVAGASAKARCSINISALSAWCPTSRTPPPAPPSSPALPTRDCGW
jgi:hypothetical protein